MVALEGYRAVAALAVLVSHTAGHVWFIRTDEPGAHLLDNLGNFGVAVFFVISGLVVTRPFIHASLAGTPRPATAPYLIRRALRVYPAYWVALVVWAAFASDELRRPGSPIGIFFLVDPYVSPEEGWLTGLFVSWSLTVELIFYLFVPVYAVAVGAVARRSATRDGRLVVHLVGVAILYLTAFAYRSAVGDHFTDLPPTTIHWLPGFLDWFALGILLAVVTSYRDLGGRVPTWAVALPRRTGASWTLAALAYLLIVLLKGDQLLFQRAESPAQMSWRFFFQGMAAFWFVVPAVLGSREQTAMAWFRSTRLVFLGTVSYGIYLWHPIVMMWFEELLVDWTPRGRAIVLTLVVTAVTVPIAMASYYWVERPMIRLGRTATQRAALPAVERPRATLSPEVTA